MSNLEYSFIKAPLTLLALLTVFFSCGENSVEELAEDIVNDSGSGVPNILLIIADDLGLDAINGYEIGILKPNTPNIDALRTSGLVFNNFWVNPTCSPTRSTLLTGKYGIRTGVLSPGDALNQSHSSLQSYIAEQADEDYSTAVIGKWHLSNNNTNPESYGIDYFSGLLSGGAQSYYSWDLFEDGNISTETEYITKKFTDLSIDWVQAQEDPWFLWLAYTAPHTPFHLPPAEMHSQGALSDDEASIDANPLPYYFAAIEAMDYQIGELLASIDEEARTKTLIIFMGDNGTPITVAQAPYSRTNAKGSLGNGGVNVPLFISGANVSRRGTDNSLINGTDLYATIASAAGIAVTTVHDSQNFLPLLQSEGAFDREYLYTEIIDNRSGVEGWAIRNEFYKLITYDNGLEAFYDLSVDPNESDDLSSESLSDDQEAGKTALVAQLIEIRNE